MRAEACGRACRVLVLLACLTASASAAETARPNVVLIVSDDHNWRDYSFTGENPYVATPNIDALAREGVLFSRAYTPTSICRPSLAGLFTGLHAVTTGITGNDPAPRGAAFPDSFENELVRRNVELHATLPRILGELGYRSLQTGKWWEGDYRRAGFDAGFTTDASRHLAFLAPASIGRAGLGPIEDFVRDAARDGVPFFVSYAPLLPHTPHTPPARFRDRYAAWVASGEITGNEADYYAMVDWLDDTVGRLRELLRATEGRNGRSLDDDTLYVYAVDNGWRPLRTGSQLPVGAPKAKRSPFDDGVRGPLILHLAGRVTDGRPIARKLGDTRLASTLDVLPTVLAVLGSRARTPALAQGIDLTTESRRRVYGASYDVEIPVSSGSELVHDQRERARTSRWLIEGRWKLIVFDGNADDGVQLYDVLADPGETANRAGEEPDRVAELTHRLDAWWKSSRPVLRYAHEFRGGPFPLDGVLPDVARGALPAAWSATPGVLADGTLDGGERARLAFEPEAGRRYELRASLAAPIGPGGGIALGFLGAPRAHLAREAVGEVLLRDGRVSGTSDGVLRARRHPLGPPLPVARFERSDLAPIAVTLVLDTGSAGPGAPWSLQLLLDGIPQATHVYRGRPRIRGVGIRGSGERLGAGSVDYVQLLERPLAASRAARRGDANGDDAVDVRDVVSTLRNLTGPQTLPPSFAKTLGEGDFDGDGDVDRADLDEVLGAARARAPALPR